LVEQKVFHLDFDNATSVSRSWEKFTKMLDSLTNPSMLEINSMVETISIFIYKILCTNKFINW